jgi:hypothetical protein
MMTKVSNIVDVYVGARLRMRRTMLGMSQSRLGELLGVTFQQVQTASAQVVSSIPLGCLKSHPAISSKARQLIRRSRVLLKGHHNPTLSTSSLRPKVFSSIARFCEFATPKYDDALSTWSSRWRRRRTKSLTIRSFGKSNKLAKTA